MLLYRWFVCYFQLYYNLQKSSFKVYIDIYLNNCYRKFLIFIILMMYICIQLLIFDLFMIFYVYLNYKLGYLIYVIDEFGLIWFMKKVIIVDLVYFK